MASIHAEPERADQPAPLDGRLARSERTRLAIVDAMRALHHDGDLRPTAPRVAERAGVSVRTVWQHFEDLETLLVAAGQRDLEIARTFVTPIDASLPLADRIGALVDQRARMFEAMSPPWRAARLHEPFSAQIRTNRDTLIDLARAQLRDIFAPELHGAPPALLDAVLAASNWAAWESLRADLGLAVSPAKQALALWLSKLLG